MHYVCMTLSFLKIVFLHHKSCLRRIALYVNLSTNTVEILRKNTSVKKKMESANSPVKPPNVLVYVGDNQQKLYKNIANNLRQCLNSDSYIIYPLMPSQVVGEPWKNNVVLLVVSCENIEENIAKSFADYVQNDGKLLIFCSSFNIPIAGVVCGDQTSPEGVIKVQYKNLNDAILFHGKCSYSASENEVLLSDSNGKPVVIKAYAGKGVIIASEVHLEVDPTIVCSSDLTNFEHSDEKRMHILKLILTEDLGLKECSLAVSELTPGYVIVKNDIILQKLKSSMAKCISLGKNVSKICDTVISDKVSLLFEDESSMQPYQFVKDVYFSKLKTITFGQIVVFFQVTTSTMDIAGHLSEQEGVVIIASRQVAGRGRSDNKWLSPEGCAMFTLHFTLPLTSRLGQRLSILQHIASLAIVHSIKKIPNYEKLDLSLKWPNDIYCNKKNKIGGVIANTTIQGNVAHVFIGCGVNVANSEPTICINDMIENYNSLHNANLDILCTEEVIAYTLNEIEALVEDFNNYGAETFQSLYFSYWMHGKQRVTLSSMNEKATVLGIDDYGFLIVKTDQGQKLILQPDGNRFDIMQNLIIMK